MNRLTSLQVHLVLFVIFSRISGKIISESPRILGGQLSEIGHVPYVVSLRYQNKYYCSGSIINNITILTAASCNRPEVNEIKARVGSKYYSMKGKTIRAKRFIAHPDFNNDTLDKDIAVIWLEKPMKLKKTVKPILLPEHSERLPKVGTFLTVSGWGVIDSKGNATPAEELRSVQLPLLSKQVCKNCYPELELTDSVFCAGYFLGGRGASFQDSGGPVVYNGKQYGVVSLGGDIDEFPLSPNIFSSVPKLRGFIRRNMGKVFNNTLKE